MASEENMTLYQKSAMSDLPTGELTATVHQIAVLNNMIPRGFKFEVADNMPKINKPGNKSSKRKKHVIY